MDEIESTISGIPCIVRVTHYESAHGDSISDNAADYHGSEDIEFEILDRKGYPAAWLDRKKTGKDVDRIETEISNYYGRD